ncbi:MAG: (deoxy)nucleoside triphosphate pyrophosphohydrolase [bacterium]|nr:(deoxy)nucleoside triphosphate pyrophosphohydrolase [bacterium]
MIQVTCAILIQEGRILAAQRGPEMHLSGRWEFPGGKVEAGESEADCLRREIKEELNLEIQPYKRLPESRLGDGERTICLIPYLCRLEGGMLTVKEHEQVIWCDPEKLVELNWCDADVPIVRYVYQNWKTL